MITNPLIPTGAKEGVSGIIFFQKLIPSLITIAIAVGVIIFFFNLIAGAIQWISSGGEKEAVSQARKRITNALIGIVILFIIFALAALIEYFFNIKILTLDIDSLVIK